METGFWIFMLVMDFLLPLIMVVFGKLFQHCPEEINSVFGYRTRRSMASQEAWNFAHHVCGKLWFRWGLVLLPVTVGLMLLVWGRDTGTVGLFGAVVMVVQLAVLLLSQVGAFLPAARAAGGYSLQNGTAIIKSGMSDAEVNRALTRALVVGFDQMSEADQNTLLDSLTWEYYTNAVRKDIGFESKSDKMYWDSIGGGRTVKEGKYVKITYTCPALAKNDDGNYQVRVRNTNAAVTLTKVEKLDSSISLRSGVQVKMPYTDAGALDFNALRARIFEQVVASSKPNLTVNDVHIEYYAKSELVSHKEWVKLEGEFVTVPLFDKKVGYPAISEGNWKIKITFDGNADYKGCSREMDVTFLDRDPAPFHLKGGVTEVGIVYNADQSINYAATERALREALIESTDPSYPVDLVKVQYNIYGTSITDDWIANYKDLSYKVLDSDLLDGIKAGKFGLGDQLLRLSWRQRGL